MPSKLTFSYSLVRKFSLTKSRLLLIQCLSVSGVDANVKCFA